MMLSFYLQPVAVVNSQTLAEEIQIQNEALASNKGAGYGEARDIRIIVALVIKSLLSLLGILFTVYVIYGGALIMMSAGEEEQITKGKNIIKNGVIGIALILGSYGIVWFVYFVFFTAMNNPFNEPLNYGQRPDTGGMYR